MYIYIYTYIYTYAYQKKPIMTNILYTKTSTKYQGDSCFTKTWHLPPSMCTVFIDTYYIFSDMLLLLLGVCSIKPGTYHLACVQFLVIHITYLVTCCCFYSEFAPYKAEPPLTSINLQEKERKA